MAEQLHVYTNGPDKVVAYNDLQARDLLTEYATEEFDDGMSVELVSDDNILTIFFEEEKEIIPEGATVIGVMGTTIKATCESWAKWNGVGFLSTINY